VRFGRKATRTRRPDQAAATALALDFSATALAQDFKEHAAAQDFKEYAAAQDFSGDAGAQISSEEWMHERLAEWVGRVLTQVRVNAVSCILDFQELEDDFSAWLYADEFRVGGSGGGSVDQRVRRTSSEAVIALHALLGREVTAAEVTEGNLRLAFVEGREVLVAPHASEQAWALSFEQGGSITCEAGGALSVRVAQFADGYSLADLGDVVVDAERAVGQVRGWVMAGLPEKATRALRRARVNIDALIQLLPEEH
jgi:hypothetical protein